MRNSTPLHPEGNSLVERFNASLKKLLHHLVVSDRPRDWHLTLPYLLSSYHELPNATISLSPFQLVYGRLVCDPLGVFRDCWSDVSVPVRATTTRILMCI